VKNEEEYTPKNDDSFKLNKSNKKINSGSNNMKIVNKMHTTYNLNKNKIHFDINNELPEYQQYQLKRVLEIYYDCFVLSPMDLG
jgi:hypothetical protein